MYKVIASMFTGLALSACGGGSTTSGAGSPSASNPGLAALNAAVAQSGTNANMVIGDYSSGDSVVALQVQCMSPSALTNIKVINVPSGNGIVSSRSSIACS